MRQSSTGPYGLGYVERGVEKSGRHRGQAWWEKWGEQHNGEARMKQDDDSPVLSGVV